MLTFQLFERNKSLNLVYLFLTLTKVLSPTPPPAPPATKTTKLLHKFKRYII